MSQGVDYPRSLRTDKISGIQGSLQFQNQDNSRNLGGWSYHPIYQHFQHILIQNVHVGHKYWAIVQTVRLTV